MGGAEGLGAQDGVEAVRGEGVEDAVVEDARGVDDAGERQVGGEGAEERGELVAVGDVAVGDGDAGAVRGEFGGEVGDAGRVGAAAAGEDQVRTPCRVTRWRARMPPMVPVPPVIRTVPSGSQARGTVRTILP